MSQWPVEDARSADLLRMLTRPESAPVVDGAAGSASVGGLIITFSGACEACPSVLRLLPDQLKSVLANLPDIPPEIGCLLSAGPDSPFAAHPDHHVGVAVLLQAGVPARGDLEIAQVKGRGLPVADQHLANDLRPVVPLGLVALHLQPVPGEVGTKGAAPGQLAHGLRPVRSQVDAQLVLDCGDPFIQHVLMLPDACAGFGDVTIRNRSRTHRVALELSLSITPRAGNGESLRGVTPTREDISAIARRGLAPQAIFRSPIELAPRESLRRELVFVIRNPGAAPGVEHDEIALLPGESGPVALTCIDYCPAEIAITDRREKERQGKRRAEHGHPPPYPYRQDGRLRVSRPAGRCAVRYPEWRAARSLRQCTPPRSVD